MRQTITGFGFFTGASYPFRAVGILSRNSSLWQYLIIPIFLNLILGIIIYGSLLWWGLDFLDIWLANAANWFDNLIANLPSWLSFLEYLILAIAWLLRFILIIALLILTGFIFFQFGVLLGAPWYGQLSEKLEKLRTNNVTIIEVGIIKDIWRAILFEIKKLVFIGLGGLFLLLLNFFPGIGTIAATIGGITLTNTIVCLDFFDAPLERRRFRFRKKLGIVWGNLPASGGFGLVCLGLISLPVLNLLTIPICVASGTLFFCDRILPKL